MTTLNAPLLDCQELFGSNYDYPTCNALPSANDGLDTNYMQVRNGIWLALYHILRSIMVFDTTGIPLGAIITSVTLYIFYMGSGDDDVVVQKCTAVNPIVVGDFDRTKHSGNYAQFNDSAQPLNTVVAHALLPSVITKGGLTSLSMRQITDININVPFNSNDWVYGNAGHLPVLVVEYTTSVPPRYGPPRVLMCGDPV